MKRRQAFTLVELMVSMALIIFMMAILSQAFIAGLTTFRNLKGQGDLAEKLRSTTQILQHDLAANHFEGSRRLSDPTFWNNGPPQQGFFQIWQTSASLLPPLPAALPLTPASYTEGYDLDILPPGAGIPSYLTTNHYLSFTVRLVGNDMGDFMSASAAGGGALLSNIQTFGPVESRYQLTSGGAYNYQWAAVAWFLAPQMNPSTGVQDTTAPDPTAGTLGVPLYTLYRRQCLLVPDNQLVSIGSTPAGGYSGTQIGKFAEMSCFVDAKSLGNIYFNSPRDITIPANRLSSWGGGPPYTPIPATSPLYGSDIQLTDVVSFDVRLLPLYPVGTTSPNPADPFVTLFDPPFTGATFTYTAPTGVTGMVFDTWSSYSNGINDYSKWATPNNADGTSIPFWTTNPVIYQYPVGTGRTFPPWGKSSTLGSGPIIRAIQVTIRIWDFKTNQTRQVTIVQAM
jgi:type II secretory pathway pseudopilin PulG